eukprot:445698_1
MCGTDGKTVSQPLKNMKRSLVPILDEEDSDDNKEANPTARPNKRRRVMNSAIADNDGDIIDLDDFIVLKKRSKRRKKDNDDDDATVLNNCSICLEPLNSSGYHQICCLKCGHIFGRKCIEKTIKKRGLCPMCKTTATTAQIRNLFNTNISVRDIGDRDNWVNKYHQLMSRLNNQMCMTHALQTKLDKMRYKCNKLEDTNKTLKAELVQMKTKYHEEQDQRIELMTQYQNELHMQPPRTSVKTLPWDEFRFDHTRNTNNISITQRIGIPLKTQMFKKISCQRSNVFEYGANAENVYYSYEHLHSQYDIGMSCLMRSNQLQESTSRIQVGHVQQINDIRYNKQTQCQILSIADDRTMVVSDIRSKKERQYFVALPVVGKRCLWSNHLEYYLFAACVDGCVCAYDIRVSGNKNLSCRRWINHESMQPIHTLQSMKNNQILIGTNNECYVLNEDELINPNGNALFAPIVKQQGIYSCSSNEECDSILVSYKDGHSMIDLHNANHKISIGYSGLNEDGNTDILCMNSSNKYICFTDKKQRLNVYSCNYNHNDAYRSKKTLHQFNNTICRGVKAFQNKIVGALCSKYLVFYRCSV